MVSRETNPLSSAANQAHFFVIKGSRRQGVVEDDARKRTSCAKCSHRLRKDDLPFGAGKWTVPKDRKPRPRRFVEDWPTNGTADVNVEADGNANASNDVPSKPRTEPSALVGFRNQNIGDIFEHIKDVAVSLEANSDPEGVQKMYRLSEDVCESQAELEAMKQTLHWMGLEGGYEGRRNHTTDFGKMMEKKMKEYKQNNGHDPTQHESVLDIKQAVWEIHHPNEPFPGTEDARNEEVVIAMTQSERIARNKTCPISGRSIFDLKDPVKDKHGYVYEKEYIMQMFQRGTSAIECPVAGTTHQIKKADLKTAKELLRERQRRKLTQRSRKDTKVNETILE